MSECMTQEDAMNMSNEQAVAILKPLMNMMRDQYGCPISDAYFALDKAITALLQPQRMRGEWIEDGYNHYKAVCSECGEPCATYVMGKPRDNYCKWCGADMREGEKMWERIERIEHIIVSEPEDYWCDSCKHRDEFDSCFDCRHYSHYEKGKEDAAD